MSITKSSIWGSVALVVLVAVLLGFRAHYLAKRDECRHRLLQIVPVLESYAQLHHGTLPASVDELAKALGVPLPTSTIHQPSGRFGDTTLARLHTSLSQGENNGLPYHMATLPQHWKSGKAQPYLWDAMPHNYVSGVHVLYTDGRVTTEDAVP